MFHTPNRALVAGAIMLLLLGGAALAMPAHAQQSDHAAVQEENGSSTATSADVSADSEHAEAAARHEYGNDSSLSVHATTEGDELVVDVEYDGADAATVEIESSDGGYDRAGTYRVHDERTFRLPLPEDETVEVTVEGDRIRSGFVLRPAEWGECLPVKPHVLEPTTLERYEDGEWVPVHEDRSERTVRPPADPCTLRGAFEDRRASAMESASGFEPEVDRPEIDHPDVENSTEAYEPPEIPEFDHPGFVELPWTPDRVEPEFERPEVPEFDASDLEGSDVEEPDADEQDAGSGDSG